MSLDAARRLVEGLDLCINEDDLGYPHFNDPTVHPFPLAKDGFRIVRDVKSGRKVAFVDGGNQELIGAPNFSVQLNRVYMGVWSNKSRVSVGMPRVEFFSATFSSFRNDKIFFETFLVPGSSEFERYLPEGKDVSFDSFDRSIMKGNQRADIDTVASIARRFAEWRFASLALKHLSKGDILVMDGTLQTGYTKEVNYLRNLSAAAKDRGIILTGLSKTSALFTTTGLSLLGAVSKLAEDIKISQEWYYPVAESVSEDHNVMILAVKLNRISERVYRYEIQREQFNSLNELQINEVLTALVQNSCDPTFPGYPYGLIDADAFARVSFDEIEYYRGIIISQISALGKLGKFNRHIRAIDAHSILNMLIE